MLPSTSSPSTMEGPFFHFPSPFLDELYITQTLSQHNPPVITTGERAQPTNNISAKRTDRHSKIRTAKGLRDRRMRLSLAVSRRFFDLQDMLGFDKASKTIDWLLNNCKHEINKLNYAGSGKYVTSESDIVAEELAPSSRKVIKRRPICNVDGARESRDKARERARRRTREKLIKFSNNPQISKPDTFSNEFLGFLEPCCTMRSNKVSVLGNDGEWNPSSGFLLNPLPNSSILMTGTSNVNEGFRSDYLPENHSFFNSEFA